MRKLKELPEDTRAKLEEITDKELFALTAPDIEFLKARRDYLDAEQLEKYDSVLNKQTKKTK